MSGAELYRFRAPTRADLAVFAGWLRTTEVVRWWGEPAEQLALIAEDLDNPHMRQWVVGWRGADFAYAQACEVDRWPQAHMGELPPGTVAIDAFVGVAAMLGVGHGGRFLRRLAEMLLADGAAEVAIDPDAANGRARRAYARAGFVGDEVVETAEGPVVVMLFRP